MDDTGYDAWNAALAARYFNDEQAGRPVYLDTDDDLMSEVSTSIGAGDWWDSLSGAVRDTLLFDRQGALLWHLRRLSSWRLDNRASLTARTADPEPPPVVALLAVLSHVAAEMGEDTDLAPHAYYPLVGKLLRLDHDQQEQFRGAYQKSAESLWLSINEYLSWTDGRLGTPTAYSLGHRYVGLPQSQALVRSVDRVRLPRMFQRFGLTAGSDMVPADMGRLLDIWINQSPCPVSANLHRLWDKRAARDRIASIVATELAGWDGSLPVGETPENGAGAAIAMSALLRRGLRTKLELSLLVTLPGGSDRLVITSSPEQTPLDVVPAGSSRCRPRPGTDLDAETLVAGAIDLMDPTTGRTAHRSPRRVVPLRRDDLLGCYVEVERVLLAEDHLVLVKEDPRILTPVSALLDGQIGRHGAVYTHDGREGTASLGGVPDGWRLFEAVQVFGTPTVAPSIADVNALVPLATAQMTFSGGLKLPGHVRKWSSLAPPEVRVVVADSADLTLTLLDGELNVVHDWHSDQPVLVADLDSIGLADGDYTLRLKAGNRDMAEHTLRLRSAESPDAISWETAARLNYVISDGPWAALSAEHAGDILPGSVVVDGPWAPPLDNESPLHSYPTDPTWDKSRKPAAAAVRRASISLGVIDPTSCLQTGAHYFELPTYYGRASGSLVEGVCKRCGLVKRFPAYAKRPRVTKSSKELAPTAADLNITSLPPIEPRDIDWDEALDSIVHVGGGPLSALERVATQIEASSLFVDSFVRTLEGLAQVDVRRDEQLQPTEWEANPMYLAELADARWLLCGVWSGSSRSQLGALVTAAGGNLEAVPHPDQPTSWLVTGVEEAALSDISEATGLGLAPEAAVRVAEALPPLSRLREALPLVDLPQHAAASRFDVESASWIPVGGILQPGAYRLSQAFRTIDVFVTPESLAERRARVGTVHLVKHLAALDRGVPLMCLHATSGQLLVPLGADLPGLYARAAVLCSGERPRVSERLGVLSYPKVTSEVASLLADRLSR